MKRVALGLVVLLLGVLPTARAEDEAPRAVPRPPGYSGRDWSVQRDWERKLLECADDPAYLRAVHDAVCERPHPAGTAQDAWMIERLAALFHDIGIEPERHEIWPYLPRFVSASLTLVDGEERVALPVRELPEGESEADFDAYYKEVLPGWNAYSGSGDVTAEVVYANYGTREDFAKLAELGVSCDGKIVVARYGKNYRGYKAKFAEAAGAAGLIMYTDPADSGWGRGLSWPEGGYAAPSSIQRGSIKTLPYAGDPLTPGRPATKDAARVDPATLALPKIPVQCVGWIAAQPILERMRGQDVPAGWQGGLPFRYRVTQGDAPFRVRLQVEQERRIAKTANVLGVVKGSRYPEQLVIVGCHFDAWTFGAGDPHAGTIVLYALAKALAQEARRGNAPGRTIVFANWGAEEMGIIGSTEWCEANAERLDEHGVMYLNLDMAAMGTTFRCSADPMLYDVVVQATKSVAQDPAAPAQSVFDAWTADTDGKPRFGVLGGGSDHVGLYLHAGVPSVSLGAGGSKGVSYHSAHDNLRWYRQVVGDDYAGARMLTRVAAVLLARMAGYGVLPYSPDNVLREGADRLEALAARAPSTSTRLGLLATVEKMKAARLRLGAVDALRAGVPVHGLDVATGTEAARLLIRAARAWLSPAGLPERPWYRNVYAGTDPFSGYASWSWPAVRLGIELGDAAMVDAADDVIREALDDFTRPLIQMQALVDARK
ncbi:MAG: M28 family peptidase [Planctomycetota bacterium]|nr:M28 family peptidase [Planctomycetota bacterium]